MRDSTTDTSDAPAPNPAARGLLHVTLRPSRRFVAADLASKSGPAVLLTEVENILAGGPLHVLVNNAGGGTLSAGIDDAAGFSEESFDALFALNARAPTLVLHYAIPALERARGASVINISSVLGIRPSGGMAAYRWAARGAACTRRLRCCIDRLPWVGGQSNADK